MREGRVQDEIGRMKETREKSKEGIMEGITEGSIKVRIEGTMKISMEERTKNKCLNGTAGVVRLPLLLSSSRNSLSYEWFKTSNQNGKQLHRLERLCSICS